MRKQRATQRVVYRKGWIRNEFLILKEVHRLVQSLVAVHRMESRLVQSLRKGKERVHARAWTEYQEC